MRKLIANFMLVTIGREWVSETSPTEIKSIIDKSKRANELKGNALYNIDFIHLADFLLKAYSSTPSQDIYKKINSATKLQEFESIKKLLPESNWKRYFSSLVNCEDTFLQKRWSELYELRCKVAHNALVVKADFDTIQSLATELTEKLQDAIEKLPRVQVPEAEVENLVVNAAINANALIGEFVRVWNQLEGRLLDIAMEMNIPRRDVRSIVHKLAERGRLDEKQVRRFEFAISIRNSVIHSMNIEIGHEAIVGAIKHAKSLLSSLDVSPTPTHSWIAAIEKIDTSNF
jgi:hypothetical protein